jgi:small subunit ribosomal protein S18
MRERSSEYSRSPRRGNSRDKKDFKTMEFHKRRKRVCRFCEDKVSHISYHNERLLRRFINERGKIVPRRISGNCAFHQRGLTIAVKRARHLAVLPYTSEIYR